MHKKRHEAEKKEEEKNSFIAKNLESFVFIFHYSKWLIEKLFERKAQYLLRYHYFMP